jgi:hypothetical protein
MSDSKKESEDSEEKSSSGSKKAPKMSRRESMKNQFGRMGDGHGCFQSNCRPVPSFARLAWTGRGKLIHRLAALGHDIQ